MIKMVVFDMAGTVIDEDNVVYKTLQKAINEEAPAISLPQVLSEGAGKEKSQAIRDIMLRFAGISDETVIQKVFAHFQARLKEAYSAIPIQPQAGAENLFSELRHRGILVVLNTGYDDYTARAILARVGWREGEQIDALVTASDVPRNRPHPDMIDWARKKFDLRDNDRVIKVGDSAIDVEEGKNAGCYWTIGITTGAQTREQILEARPDCVIDKLEELLPLVEQNHV